MRKVIPWVCFRILKFPFIVIAGKGCVMVFREASLMQMISGRRELAVIHQNLRQNESTGALIGCKEVELGVDVR